MANSQGSWTQLCQGFLPPQTKLTRNMCLEVQGSCHPLPQPPAEESDLPPTPTSHPQLRCAEPAGDMFGSTWLHPYPKPGVFLLHKRMAGLGPSVREDSLKGV